MRPIISIIKTLFSMPVLLAIFAIISIYFIKPSPAINSIDKFLFKIESSLIKKPAISNDISLIKIPDNHYFDDNFRDLKALLKKVADTKPSAIVLEADLLPEIKSVDPIKKIESEILLLFPGKSKSEKNLLKSLLKTTRNMVLETNEFQRFINQKKIILATIPSSKELKNSGWPKPKSIISEITDVEESKYVKIIKSRFPGLLEIEPEVDKNHYSKFISAPLNNPDNIYRNLIWKAGEFHIPDLSLLLYKIHSGAKEIDWIKGKAIKLGDESISTGISGGVLPLFSISSGNNSNINTFDLGVILSRNDNSFLTNNIVLIGKDKNGFLSDSALSFESIRNKKVFYTPLWASFIAILFITIIYSYLCFILPRIRISMATVLSLFLIFAGLTIQTLSLISTQVWIPISSAIIFLVTGHTVLSFRQHRETRVDNLQKEINVTYEELGTCRFEHGEYDLAFSALKKCPSSDSILETVYNIGIEHEKRRQYDTASGVFEYIAKQNPLFKDSAERYIRLKEFSSSPASTPAGPGGTIVIPDSGIHLPHLGRYEIINEIGHGAMGTVYLGKDPRIGRMVAIKTLNFSMNDSKELNAAKTRFFREAEAAGRLSHPDIVTVYDAGEEKDLAYIAMDYAEGKTLSEYTEKKDLLPVKTVIKLIAQTAVALDYAHKQNIIHRDVKPSNIIYNDDTGQVKVTDFGIASITDASLTQTGTGTILGTPSYISPEQLKGSDVDGRSDIFSLGVTLFQLLTGELPFKGETLAALAYQIINSEAPSPVKLRKGIPKAMASIINKTLSKNPDDRYSEAIKLAQELQKFC